MQLRVIAIVVAVSASVRADTNFLSKVQVYTDSDHTQVVSPVVSAQSDVTPSTQVSLGYLADIVTSASVDIVTQASKTTIHDTRHQVSAGVAQKIAGTWTVHVDYAFSRENDYLSHNISGGVAKELDEKNTTLALGYALSLDTVGRADDENFSRALTAQRASASWTQVISPRAIAQVTYEIGDAEGYQASPYRFVPVRASLDSAPEFWIAETDPSSRWRHALVVGANRAIGDASSIQGDIRAYHDTWGITSATFGARYFVDLARRLELRLRERFYVQNGASFYRDNYTMPMTYMVYDRELSPLWSETFGVKLDDALSRHASAELKADVFYYSYADFPPLPSRLGANLGIGVSLTY